MAARSRDPDDELVPILGDDEDDVGLNRRDAAQSATFGSEHLDPRARHDDDDADIYGARPVPRPPPPKSKVPDRPTRLADDGSYDFSDDDEPEKPRARPTKAPSPDAIVGERHCRQCGYNLRGLPASGRCPECGTPIAASQTAATAGRHRRAIAPDELLAANTNWLKKLVLGARLAFWSIVAAFFVGIVLAIVGTPPIVNTTVNSLITLTMAGGFWLLTEPEGTAETIANKRRIALRVLAVAGAGATLIDFGLTLTLANRTTPPPTVFLIISGILGFAWIWVFPVSAAYFSVLAARARDAAVEQRADTVVVFLGGTLVAIFGLALVAVVLSAISAAGGGAAGGGMGAALPLAFIAGCVALVMLIPLLIFGFMYVLLLGETTIMLRTMAEPTASTEGLSPDAVLAREQAIAAARRSKQTMRISR